MRIDNGIAVILSAYGMDIYAGEKCSSSNPEALYEAQGVIIYRFRVAGHIRRLGGLTG